MNEVGASGGKFAVDPDSATSRFQGVVDAFDRANGLTGWCVNLTRPQAAVELELLIDALVIARARTELDRPDVNEMLGVGGQFGFRFDASVFERLLAHRDVLGSKSFAVRIADSGLLLAPVRGDASLSGIFAAMTETSNCDETKSLLEDLRRLGAAAAPLMTATLRNAQGAPDGFIETIALGSNGVVWFVGWARRNVGRDLSVAIFDRHKYRAGIMAASFDREDLPADSTGLVGVLDTDWRPSWSQEAIFLIDEESGRHLRATRPLRVSKVKDVLPHLEQATFGEDLILARRLLAFSQVNDGWDAESPEAGAVRVAIDAAAALEGFGIFMKGWIYSPTRAVTDVHLKLGDRQYICNPRSLSFSHRPDLLQAYPTGRQAVERAGFRCIFEMEAASSSYREIGLKVVYEDGRASHHRLPDIVIHKLAPDDDGGRFKEFYPHLERQAVFASYARVYYDRCLALYGGCKFDVHDPAPIAIIFVAPSERGKLYLMFEEARQHVRRCVAKGVGIVIMAGEDAYHGEIRELFHTLRQEFDGPCSLAFVHDPRFALWALDSALVALGARRFVFVGSQVVMNADGWAMIAELLRSEPRLFFLEVADPCEPWAEPKQSTQAFAWSSEAFLNWRRSRRLPIGPTPSARAFGAVEPSHVKCGTIDSDACASTTLDAINVLVGAC